MKVFEKQFSWDGCKNNIKAVKCCRQTSIQLDRLSVLTVSFLCPLLSPILPSVCQPKLPQALLILLCHYFDC